MSKKTFSAKSEKDSLRMRRIKSKGTKLERAMKVILNDMDLEFLEQPKIIGLPDFKLSDYQVVIFCDSSFWHGRNPEDVSGKNFKRNKKLWVEKLKKTKHRDKKVNKELKRQGFKVLRFWDDEILKSPERVKKVIKSNLVVKLPT